MTDFRRSLSTNDKCPQCKRPIVRTTVPPLEGEVRRTEWECKCSAGGANGAAVEWLPQGNVTVRARLIPQRAR